MKRKNWGFIVVISLISIYLILFAIGNFYIGSHGGVYIFESISESHKISELDCLGKVVTIYDSPDKDEGIEDLDYTAFYGAKFRSYELNFEIFAYEFSSDDDAQRYFENASGKSGGINPRYSSSGGFFSRNIIAIYDNKAYLIRTSLIDELKLSHELSEIFSIKIDWIK